MATGDVSLGFAKRDKNGDIVETKSANWSYSPDGGSVAVGKLDPDTLTPIEPASFFGNWDAAGYLSRALDLLNPSRAINVPNIKAIVGAAIEDGDEDFICQYCQGVNCVDCTIDEWKREFQLYK